MRAEDVNETKKVEEAKETKVVFSDWDQPFQIGWVFWYSIGRSHFLFSLVDRRFEPASSYVETVKKTQATTAVQPCCQRGEVC